jgi:hypothetical protein
MTFLQKGVTTQETTTDIFTAVRISDLTKHHFVSSKLTTMGQSQIYIHWKQLYLRYEKKTSQEFGVTVHNNVAGMANDKNRVFSTFVTER